MENKKNYGKQFDEYVIEYNKWLENPKISFNQSLKSILIGIGSIFNPSLITFNKKYYFLEQIKNLSSKQKEIIKNAASWKKISKNLENKLLEENIGKEKLEKIKKLNNRHYDQLKERYISLLN